MNLTDEELIRIAEELAAARARGEELPPIPEELADRLQELPSHERQAIRKRTLRATYAAWRQAQKEMP